jgi:MFS family permease
VQSIFTVGGLVGALIGGPVATKYGRLLAMQATTLVFIVGPLAAALANSIEVMVLGRFLSGIGAGASTVVCPMYVAEVSPPDQRGLFGAFTQVMITTGVLIAQLLGYFLSYNNLWRVILAVAALIGALELIGLHSISESPKWLADNAFTALARQVSQSIGADLGTEADMAGTLSSFLLVLRISLKN